MSSKSTRFILLVTGIFFLFTSIAYATPPHGEETFMAFARTPTATSTNPGPSPTPTLTPTTGPGRGTPTPTPLPGNSPTPTATSLFTPTHTPTGASCPPANVILIGAVQGTGNISPKKGQNVTVRGVVVADFQGSGEMGGFFVQDGGDSNANTSDGIFVVSSSPVNVGDAVQVSGKAAESFSRTQLNNGQATICGTAPNLTPVPLALPVTTTDDLEKYEGMWTTFSQTLYVTEVYNLGRYGEISVASERLWQPTNVTLPGPSAIAMQAANDLKRIILDDGSTIQNPDPIEFPAPGLTASNTLRVGDSVTDLTGVMDYAFGSYRIQPVSTPTWVHDNPRTAAPTVSGSLRVASFNVLNYFNGPTFPTSRGASTPEEFTRQRTKIINALVAMNADIIGLIELENDGFDANSAIQDLVNGLNDAAPPGTTYAFINPGGSGVGWDEITVGIVYRVETVQPVGAAALKTNGAFASLNRVPIAQTFLQISTGGKLTVAVNHFKSKGSACPGDPDTGDGQGNCNQTRVNAANDLVSWLATDPTASGDPDFLIIGDLNAYMMEDPIAAIKNAGYTNLIEAYQGFFAYSYVFEGQSGQLDHALTNASLTAQVVAAVEWHINPDEPIALDYNMEFKTSGQIISLYSADPYRSSDHDPVLMGLNLTP